MNKVKLEISTSKAYSKEELDEFRTWFDKDKIDVDISDNCFVKSAEIPAIVLIVCNWLALSITGGITYDLIKRLIKDIHAKKKNSKHPSIRFLVKSKEYNIVAYFSVDDVNEFDSAYKAFFEYLNEHRENLTSDLFYNVSLNKWGNFEDTEKWRLQKIK